MAESLPSTRDDAVVVEATEFAMKFHRLGMYAEAEKFCAAVLEARPDHFDALHLLGVLRQQQGNGVEALRLFGEALNANSRSADSMRSFGAALETLQRREEARAAYDRVLALTKERCQALVSRGCALASLLGRPQEALAAFDEALAIDEQLAEAHINRGVVLVALGRAQEALAAYDRAIEIEPDHPTALSNRVLALAALGRSSEVLDACDRALAVNPRDAEALYVRGSTLWSLGKLEEALECLEQAWALGHARALSMLVLNLLTIADWRRAGELSAALRERVAEGDFIYPFTAAVLGLDPPDQLKAARNYLRICLPNAPKPWSHPTPVRPDKLRIAYVSSDFRAHAVAFAIAELFERHDRSRFEIIGVSLHPNDGSRMRARIVNAFDRFHDVSSGSDESIAQLLHGLEVHIAVDLNGPTEGARPGILAYRAAPIQATYLGYPATTGAEFIDYILADETVLPFDQQPFFTEKIVHLPDCYHANDAGRQVSPATPIRRELGLPDQGLVFCCFNRSTKISAPVFDIWMRLLTQVPGSVLWLATMGDLAQANLRRAAAERGVDPERLIFAAYVARIEDHLARHRAADLFLDTLPYNAHSTACDALWAGLPVLTCAGAAFAGRVGASMLKAAGLPELVTTRLEDYEALALKLATDSALLPSMRRKLENQRLACPLFDGDRFRRHVEAAYTAMWDIHLRGESPHSFRVEANT
jgi:protein O-GlcNAc transferase